MLWSGLLFGAAGGLAFGAWMAGSLDHGGKFALFDQVPALRSAADHFGERGVFVACCAVAFAFVGLTASWRLRRALVRLRQNQIDARR